MRLVVFKQAGPRSVAMHLRYIERVGVSRDGQAGQAYGPGPDAPDVDAFEKRSQGDGHQFRFIVSPEDAVELEDLRDFTRHLIGQLNRDLGTRLEWVAVDHWDTDNPHTHVVLGGKDQAGENLVIGREYISRSMGIRAGELATSWLGPRTERDIQASLHRDVHHERFTGLDRRLREFIDRTSVIDLRVPDDMGRLRTRALLTGRLEHLQTLGLARKVDTGRWQLRADAQNVLRGLGERNDIIRTMQRTFGNGEREFTIAEVPEEPTIGRVAAKGLAGESHDKPYFLVDGLDARAHYVSLPTNANLAELPADSIVEVRRVRDSIADRNIAATAQEGLYLRRTHLSEVRRQGCEPDRAEEIVEGHTRRLEALRLAGIVERVADGMWTVPGNLVERAKEYDHRRLGGIELELHAHLPLEKQVRTIGVTWLGRKSWTAAHRH